MFDASIMSVKF